MKLKIYCLACRKHTSNIASRNVTITNKVVRNKLSECCLNKN